jgi:glycosyltransferase involved in cell wall biosynthesis
MKVAHIISGLGLGGTEKILHNLCVNDNLNKHIVISLTSAGYYGALLKKKNIKFYVCNLRSIFFFFFSFFKLIKILKYQKIDIVQTWLYHADFFGGIAACIAGIKNIIWNIRHSSLEKGKSKNSTILMVKILSKLSWFVPIQIITCSKLAENIHSKLGYCKKKMIYIPNGYDCSILKPINSKFFFIRKKFSLEKKTPLLGMIGRFDPQKDHKNLFEALSLLKNQNQNFNCILVGNNINKKNFFLISLISKYKLTNHVKLHEYSTKISEIMSELDILVLSSSSEAFPNVVAEAMSCKTPCVVTNVGDAALIVGDTGWVVPPKNPPALARSLKIAISNIKFNNWKLRCSQARLRIKKNFDIINMINSYNKVWKNVLQSNN